jgi:GT2 family glycosyltransferase
MHGLFLLGCARGGASVAAGALARSGLALGEHPGGPTLASPRGTYQAPAVAALNEALLAPAVAPEELLFDGQRWLAELPADLALPAHPGLEDALGAHVRRPFCLKDPRFVWTLPAWREHVDDARCVCVFRDPVVTAESIVETCRTSPELARLGVDRARALRVWSAAHRRVLRLMDAGGEWLVLHLDQLLTGDGLARLAAFAGVAVSRSSVVPELRRAAPLAGAPAEARALYRELCARSGQRPDGRRARTVPGPVEVAAVALVRDADRPHLPALVRALAAQRNVRCETVLVDQTSAGDLELAGARVVREARPSRGHAFARALAVTDAPWIAWVEPLAPPLPHRLARQLGFLRARGGIDLLTSDLALQGARGALHRHLAVGGPVESLPALWQGGVVARRGALDALEDTCCAPTDLALYAALRDAGRVAHLPEALSTVEEGAFEERRARAAEDACLLRLSREPWAGDPEVTVLLACHDRRDALPECLEAFARQLVPPGAFEVVAIDDGSTDGTRELARELELPIPFRLLTQPNAGAAAARNRGLPEARGRLLLFVNDDTIPAPDLVQRHIEAHRELADRSAVVLGTFEQPRAALANGLMRVLEKTPQVFGYCDFARDEELSGSQLYTCNASVPAEAVRRLGGFDETFACYGEDTELGARLDALGYRVHFRPEARAQHRHVLSFADLRWRQRVVARAHVGLYARHPALLAASQAGRTRRELARDLARVQRAAPLLERAGASLAGADLAALERAGAPFADTASRLEERLAELLARLRGLWWRRGLDEGLAAKQLSGFPELLARHPLALEGANGPLVLLRADAARAARWPRVAAAWLASEDAAGATLVVWRDPGGPPLAAIKIRLAQLAAAAGGRAAAVLDAGLEGAQRVRLLAAASAWLPLGVPEDEELRALARVAGTPERAPSSAARPAAPAPDGARERAVLIPVLRALEPTHA